MLGAIYRIFGWKTREEFEDDLLAIVASSGSILIGELAKRVDPERWPLARTYMTCERLVEEGDLRYVPSGKFATTVQDGREVVFERLAVAIAGRGRRSRRGKASESTGQGAGALAWA